VQLAVETIRFNVTFKSCMQFLFYSSYGKGPFHLIHDSQLLHHSVLKPNKLNSGNLNKFRFIVNKGRAQYYRFAKCDFEYRLTISHHDPRNTFAVLVLKLNLNLVSDTVNQALHNSDLYFLIQAVHSLFVQRTGKTNIAWE
jgi:hypothetical protein